MNKILFERLTGNPTGNFNVFMDDYKKDNFLLIAYRDDDFGGFKFCNYNELYECEQKALNELLSGNYKFIRNKEGILTVHWNNLVFLTTNFIWGNQGCMDFMYDKVLMNKYFKDSSSSDIDIEKMFEKSKRFRTFTYHKFRSKECLVNALDWLKNNLIHIVK